MKYQNELFQNKMKSLFLIFILLLFCSQMKNITYYTKNALIVWFDTILPSQFVILVLLQLIKNKLFANPNSSYMGMLLKTLLSGFLLGFPAGALLVGNAYKNNRLSKIDAYILVSSCNFFGPPFIFGFVYPEYISNLQELITLKEFLVAIYGIPTMCLLIYIMFKQLITKQMYQKEIQKTKNPHFKDQTEITTLYNQKQQISLKNAISETLLIMARLAGFMMFFTSLQFIVDLMPVSSQTKSVLRAFFEITSTFREIGLVYPLVSIFLLIIGCFSGIFQTYCILQDYHLSIVPYILLKIQLGIFAILYLIL